MYHDKLKVEDLQTPPGIPRFLQEHKIIFFFSTVCLSQIESNPINLLLSSLHLEKCFVSPLGETTIHF